MLKFKQACSQAADQEQTDQVVLRLLDYLYSQTERTDDSLVDLPSGKPMRSNCVFGSAPSLALLAANPGLQSTFCRATGATARCIVLSALQMPVCISYKLASQQNYTPSQPVKGVQADLLGLVNVQVQY